MTRGGCAFGLIVAGFVVVGCVSGIRQEPGTDAGGARCLMNLRAQAHGLLQYAAENETLLPPSARWMDRIAPYIPDERLLHCPELQAGEYGYAFNAAVAGAAPSKLPNEVPLLYESTDTSWSASEPFKNPVVPGRHLGRYNLAFPDGQAKSLLAPRSFVPPRPEVHGF